MPCRQIAYRLCLAREHSGIRQARTHPPTSWSRSLSAASLENNTLRSRYASQVCLPRRLRYFAFTSTARYLTSRQRWVIVALDCTLRDVLQHPAYEIARVSQIVLVCAVYCCCTADGILRAQFPVLWVVPRTGEYLKTFLKTHKGRVTKMEINKEQT